MDLSGEDQWIVKLNTISVVSTAFLEILSSVGKDCWQEAVQRRWLILKPCPENPKLWVPKDVEEEILYVRREFGLGVVKD